MLGSQRAHPEIRLSGGSGPTDSRAGPSARPQLQELPREREFPFAKLPKRTVPGIWGPNLRVPSSPRCNLHALAVRNHCSELCSVMPCMSKNGARRSQVSPRSCLGSGPRGCGPGSGAWRKWGVGSESSRPDFRLHCVWRRRFGGGGVSPRKAFQSPPTSASPGLEALLSAGAAQAQLEVLE